MAAVNAPKEMQRPLMKCGGCERVHYCTWDPTAGPLVVFELDPSGGMRLRPCAPRPQGEWRCDGCLNPAVAQKGQR